VCGRPKPLLYSNSNRIRAFFRLALCAIVGTRARSRASRTVPASIKAKGKGRTRRVRSDRSSSSIVYVASAGEHQRFRRLEQSFHTTTPCKDAMSNTMVLDLFNAMTAANSSRGHYEDDYEELLVPRMITIKPAYRWAIRVRDYIHVPTFPQQYIAIYGCYFYSSRC
jgi:hypothetical protein